MLGKLVYREGSYAVSGGDAINHIGSTSLRITMPFAKPERLSDVAIDATCLNPTVNKKTADIA
jgi:hypothetical protein